MIGYLKINTDMMNICLWNYETLISKIEENGYYYESEGNSKFYCDEYNSSKKEK